MNARVFIASALGGMIGSLVALSVMPALWWLGLLTGFAVGYIGYDPANVWKITKKVAVDAYQSQDFKVLVATARALFAIAVASQTIALLASPLLLVSTTPFTIIWVVLTFLFAGAPCLACINWASLSEEEETFLGKLERLKYAEKRGWELNPIFIYGYVLPIFLARLVRWNGVYLFTIARAVFVEIHSDLRLLCGFGGALGSATGYFANHVLIGAAVGGLVGLMGYQFVSKRLIKAAHS